MMEGAIVTWSDASCDSPVMAVDSASGSDGFFRSSCSLANRSGRFITANPEKTNAVMDGIDEPARRSASGVLTYDARGGNALGVAGSGKCLLLTLSGAGSRRPQPDGILCPGRLVPVLWHILATHSVGLFSSCRHKSGPFISSAGRATFSEVPLRDEVELRIGGCVRWHGSTLQTHKRGGIHQDDAAAPR